MNKQSKEMLGKVKALADLLPGDMSEAIMGICTNMYTHGLNDASGRLKEEHKLMKEALLKADVMISYARTTAGKLKPIDDYAPIIKQALKQVEPLKSTQES